MIAGLCLLASVAGSIVTAEVVVEVAAEGRTYQMPEKVPGTRVALVLGCGRKVADGRPNLYFRYRMNAASRLFKRGKVRYLLVSGDNSVRGYSEPAAMRKALIERGVPPEVIQADCAGLRTLDSVVRAKEIFGQHNIVVVSQEFHNERAIFLARHHGMQAVGYNARDVGGLGGLRAHVREKLARVKALLDCWVLNTRPKFLGPEIRIGGSERDNSDDRQGNVNAQERT